MPVSDFKYEKISVPYLSPLKFLPCLLEKAPELLFGGLDLVEGQQMVSQFWAAYKQTHGSHPVYDDHGGDLSCVLPLAVHGDEGRGVRKGNTCLLTVETPFGLGTATNVREGLHYGSCKCCRQDGLDVGADVLTATSRRNRVKMISQACHNIKGRSFLTKFLVFLLPHKVYKDPNLLQALLKQIYSELRQLYYEGCYARKRYWFAATIGFKGDFAWFCKIADLQRSYRRLADVAPMCHECGAGTAAEPYEDLSEQQSWQAGIYQQRPWSAAPALQAVPFDLAQPEKVLRRDIFHNTKMGVYRDFIGSCVILLCELKYFHLPSGPGVKNGRKHLLARAFEHFRLFCLAAHRPPAMHSFSLENFNCKTRKTYPWVSCKGSDATLLMDWLAVLATAKLNCPLDVQHVPVLRMIHTGAKAGNAWVRALYRHGLFLDRSCAESLYREGRRFIVTYNALAHRSLHDLNFLGSR